MDQSICCIKAFLRNLWVRVDATRHDEEVQQFLNGSVWDELACLLNDLRQSNPIEPFVAFKVVVIASVLERLKVKLLDNYYLRVIESQEVVDDGIVLCL